ncbi:MAG: fumarylacetoacetate hydrolase family protein [Neisseria sp.]|nr:fumarylacetoacetate hydrolase family protein [Neisseria sp.]
MKDNLIQQAAEQLFIAEQNRQPCAPIRNLFGEGLSVADAYRIQQINVERAIQSGRRCVGKKIGLTSLAVQQQLGVNEPDFGSIFADKVLMQGQALQTAMLLQPKVEAEVALVLKRDLPRSDNQLLDMLAAVDYALPAIEVVDSRIQNWDIRIGDTIADNASSAAVFLGQQAVSLKDLDLIQLSMQMSDGENIVSEGNGKACLGNPLWAATWLANTMAKQGTPLQAGDLILTGALGPMVNVVAGKTYQAHITGLGTVNAEFV